MVQDRKKSEDQHYVPKMLLRRFAADPAEKQQIHVFDKKTDRTFPTNIRNIATERGFYETENTNGQVERVLSELEANTSPVIDKILVDKSLKNLDVGEKGWLSVFIATQSLRTKQLRENIRQTFNATAEHVRAMGHDPNEVQGLQPIESEDDLTDFAMGLFGEMIKESSDLIGEKVVFLSTTTPANPFWISDHPVVMRNSNDFGPYGNIGLAVPGIEIYLPLSSTMLLCLWCNSIADRFALDLDKAERTRGDVFNQMLTCAPEDKDRLKQMYKRCNDAINRTKSFVEVLQNGTAAEATEDNVIRYNSLQVSWSHRFVMSAKNDFALAKQMIEDNPRFREGIKMEFG